MLLYAGNDRAIMQAETKIMIKFTKLENLHNFTILMTQTTQQMRTQSSLSN